MATRQHIIGLVAACVSLMLLMFICLNACSEGKLNSSDIEGTWGFEEGELHFHAYESDEFLDVYRGGTAEVTCDKGGTYSYLWEIDNESKVVNFKPDGFGGETTSFILEKNENSLIMKSVDGEISLSKISG